MDISPKFRGCPASSQGYIYFELEHPEDQYFSAVQSGIHPDGDTDARVRGVGTVVAIATILPSQ